MIKKYIYFNFDVKPTKQVNKLKEKSFRVEQRICRVVLLTNCKSKENNMIFGFKREARTLWNSEDSVQLNMNDLKGRIIPLDFSTFNIFNTTSFLLPDAVGLNS